MKKKITIIKQNDGDITDFINNPQKTDLLFKELQQDTIGKSSSNPIWGYVYSVKNGNLSYKGIGLHKEYDYDNPLAAYAERAWSIIGREILDRNCKSGKNRCSRRRTKSRWNYQL